MLSSIKKFFGFDSQRRLSPLKIELKNLRRSYAADDERMLEMSDNFWRNGGVCCPGCGVPGYNDLRDKQYRRLRRIEGIEKKLERDG